MSAYLPGILADIARVAGEGAALQIAREAGGTEIALSSKPGSRLASIVGDEAAAKIVIGVGQGKVLIPMANLRGAAGRRAAAAQLMDEGKSAAEAARRVDIHERTARRARKQVNTTLPLLEMLSRK